MAGTIRRYALTRNPEEDWGGTRAYSASGRDVADAARRVLGETGALRGDWDAIMCGWDPTENFAGDSECVREASAMLLEGYPEGSVLDCDTEDALTDAFWPQFEGWDR